MLHKEGNKIHTYENFKSIAKPQVKITVVGNSGGIKFIKVYTGKIRQNQQFPNKSHKKLYSCWRRRWRGWRKWGREVELMMWITSESKKETRTRGTLHAGLNDCLLYGQQWSGTYKKKGRCWTVIFTVAALPKRWKVVFKVSSLLLRIPSTCVMTWRVLKVALKEG